MNRKQQIKAIAAALQRDRKRHHRLVPWRDTQPSFDDAARSWLDAGYSVAVAELCITENVRLNTLVRLDKLRSKTNESEESNGS